MKVHTSDVLIIGSGLAGLHAAWRLPVTTQIILISKATEPFANSWHAQGGIAAALGKDDTTASHYDDTLRAGSGISDPDATLILVEEGKTLMQQLINEGLHIDTQSGAPSLGLEGGHTHRRILHLDGDLSGRRTMEFLHQQLLTRDNIQIFHESEVLQLTGDKNQCHGGYIYHHDTGEVSVVYAGATLMATGGMSALYPRSTNPAYSIGDGVAMAWEVGAVLQDMEFIQFHPTAFCLPGERAFLISEAVRGEGAKLVNNNGKPFLSSLGELATRDLVSRAIIKEMASTGEKNVNLDLRHLDKKYITQRFASIHQFLQSKNLDMTSDLIPVAPAAHYMVGGIKTDLWGRSTLKGLYAAGEVASTGVMGANRLASNSLLECIVFSNRVAESIVNDAHPLPTPKKKFLNFSYQANQRKTYQRIRQKIEKYLHCYAGIIRDEKGLQIGIEKTKALLKCAPEGLSYYGIKSKYALHNTLFVMESAYARKESRGVHFRADFPESKTEYLRHSEIQKGKEIRFNCI
ncbi:MAG: L-aspartate oxidase [Bacteroidales bacterium]|nr:L-aspartate oxidase [Bacteroidales bacterium]MDD2321983.1 L-aspartate oxidase [Bacteroidales bacterium]MDD3010294.1 L-aspartate oxidase [Bacteroidales bacterium]MDD3960851.1 L-aspartate oxidase [Bacteroidales bacterium]MDY0284666.1 L-aspartate oxidase [Bacteroidales bacterium]